MPESFVQVFEQFDLDFLPFGELFIDQIITVLIILVISLTIGIFLQFSFLLPSNEQKFKGFADWLYRFLTFKQLFLDGLLKALYIVSAFFVTISSFYILFTIRSVPAFLIFLIGGNIALRLAYELIMLPVVICRNTSEISRKLSKLDRLDRIAENTDITRSISIDLYKPGAKENEDDSQQLTYLDLFCTNCGQRVNPEMGECGNCGTPIEQEST
ncbi:MAG TPA: hypothetical protein PLZ84_04675 [Clostridia bacterium]|nr:hypothetical protein [Clostridia bacterium]